MTCDICPMPFGEHGLDCPNAPHARGAEQSFCALNDMCIAGEEHDGPCVVPEEINAAHLRSFEDIDKMEAVAYRSKDGYPVLHERDVRVTEAHSFVYDRGILRLYVDGKLATNLYSFTLTSTVGGATLTLFEMTECPMDCKCGFDHIIAYRDKA